MRLYHIYDKRRREIVKHIFVSDQFDFKPEDVIMEWIAGTKQEALESDLTDVCDALTLLCDEVFAEVSPEYKILQECIHTLEKWERIFE